MNRFLVLVSFLVLASATQLGAVTDPGIHVDDPLCSEEPCAPYVGGPTGTTPFTFAADIFGGGITTFEVDPSNTVGGFFNLDIETRGNFSPVTCASNKFVCTVTPFPGVTDMFFSTDEVNPGFGARDVFTIDLNDCVTCVPEPDSGSWGPGNPFFAFPDLPNGRPLTALISAPEPGTLVLLALGMAGLLACRKFTDLLRLGA